MSNREAGQPSQQCVVMWAPRQGLGAGQGLSRGPWFGLGCPSDFETTHVASLQKVDVTSKAVAEVLARTIEYLQPNPGRGTS